MPIMFLMYFPESCLFVIPGVLRCERDDANMSRPTVPQTNTSGDMRCFKWGVGVACHCPLELLTIDFEIESGLQG